MLKLWNQFRSEENGSVFIMVAASSLMLIGATGAAVDMARAQTLQAKLSSTLDAAGLAAGATASTTNPVTQATRYFNANFPQGYLDSGAVTLNTNCADINGNSVTCNSPSMYTINLSATTNQATTFMKAMHVNSVTVAATTQITRQTSGMELSLVLDNTGSMSRSVDGHSVNTLHPSKLTAVKCALAGDAAFTPSGNTTCETNNLVTSGLLDILYGSNATLPDLFVGVIPFSDMVNMNVTSSPGSAFVNNSFPGGKSNYQGTHGGCLDSRSPNGASVTDSGIILPSGDTITLDIADDAPVSSGTFFQALPSAANSECPNATVQPMSLNKSDAVTTIQNMTANGSTLLPMGLAWGWRMLSPNWTGQWGSSPGYTYPGTTTTVSLPLPYNTTKMLKVIVFMTDGINSNGFNNDTANPTGASNANNAYGKQTYEPSNTTLDQLTKDTCDAMKSKGIIIYVIGFGTADPHSPPTNGDRNGNNSYVDVPLLQYCATQNYTGDTSHFFLAPTNAELTSAFQQIGEQLANLRVSQ